MKQLIIIGASAFSEIVYKSIEQDGLARVIAFAIESKYYKNTEFCNHPVVRFEELSQLYDMSNVYVLNTIGYVQMNDVRQRVNLECARLGYKQFKYISPRAQVDSSASVEEGCIVLPYVQIGANVHLGESCILFYGACLTHHIEVGDYCFISSGVVVGGCTSIGNNSFIGINSTISNDLRLSPYTFVGATCYIAKNTEENSAYVVESTKKIERWTSKDLIRLVK